MSAEPFSPKTFLKARRPERFSDTVVENVTELDRSCLEYWLNSITSRSQENDFERFARKICQLEICPNLLPHTGPSGGGDSKVDSETFPVAETLAYMWFGGLAQEASQERWAFAFSAKADWLPKAKSDIEKIVGTKREYKKAFFVTNQAVPDRKRAEIEDDLRIKHSIDVRILDRTWILDRIFKGQHEELVATELGIKVLSRSNIVKGPNDVKRERKLEEVEKRINDAPQNGPLGQSIVEDALLAADLSRNVELPREAVEGRYSRADRLALKFGTLRQQVESSYQWAWTLFWWFEDYSAFADQYSVVEKRVIGSRNVFDLERLSTLWKSLHGHAGRHKSSEEDSSYAEHSNVLIRELERLRGEKDRPSTALQAEAILLQVQLMLCIAKKEPVGGILQSFKDVISRSKGLVGFPFEPLVDIFTEIGPIFEDVAAYDELFSLLVQAASVRDGEVRAARLLLQRGEHQYIQGHPLKAISTLGQALGRLYKHETRHEIVKALYLCGCAYDDVGLPWAARGTLLVAASVATDDYWRYGEVTPYQAACYRRLKWIELRLGRLPHILAWHELDMGIRQELGRRGYDAKALFKNEPPFGALLGRLLLRTNFSDLKKLEKLPDTLDGMGLEVVADALLYALGDNGRLEKSAKAVGEDPETFANNWRELKADAQISDSPAFYEVGKVVLNSKVLGCRITVECDVDPLLIEVAESFLAIIESFLATTIFDKAIAREPELRVEVKRAKGAGEPISVSVVENEGRPFVVVSCHPFDPFRISSAEFGVVRDLLFRAAVEALTNVVSFKDAERDIESLFRDERVFERSVAFTCTFKTQANVLGALPKNRLSSWINAEAKAYPLSRTESWQPVIAGATDKSIEIDHSFVMNGSEPPPELLDPKARTHNQLETVSIIRERLWGRAGWSGTFFLTDVGNKYAPILGFIFRDREAAQDIFKYWRKEFGSVDTKEKIRITIVRGIDKKYPFAYSVVVGSNPEAFLKDTKFVGFVSRSHRMDAQTPDNLNRFLINYEAVGALLLAPAFAPPGFDGSQTPEIGESDFRIGIHRVIVRNAWEIGMHDTDSVAIHEDDDPVIPEGVENPPVLALIQSRKK